MTIDWRTIQLGEMCQIELGATPPRGSPRFWNTDRTSGNVWLSIADLPSTINAVVSDSKEYLSDEGAARGKVVKKGTLLVSFKLTLGRLAWAGCDLRTNEAIAALSIKDDRLLDKGYLYWFLTHFDWHKAAEGEDKVKGKTLNKEKLKALPVLVPPLEEQRRIVVMLDEAFAAIATATTNAEKNLANARELFEATLATTFGGISRKKVSISDVCHEIVDCVNRTAPKVEYETPYIMIRTTNVRDGRINLDKVNYVDEPTYLNWIRRQKPRRGDIILTREAPLGEVGMVTGDERVFLGQRLVSYRADPKKIRSRFLLFCLQSPDVQSQIQRLASGATVQHMRVPDSKILRIPCPPLPEQDAIVAILDSVLNGSDRIIRICRKKLGELAALKQAILGQEFGGQPCLTLDQSIAA